LLRSGGLADGIPAAVLLQLLERVESFVPGALDAGNVLAETIDQSLHIEFAAGDDVWRFDGAVLSGELVLAGGGPHQDRLIEGGGEVAFQANEFGLGDRHLLDEGGFGGRSGKPFRGEVGANPIEIGVALEIEEVLFGAESVGDGIAGDGGFAFGERGPVEALALRRLASIFLRDDIGGFFRLYVSGLAVGNGPAISLAVGLTCCGREVCGREKSAILL
jgi:hypothetical protein